MQLITKADVLAVLEFHMGKHYGIGARDLAEHLGIPPRRLRQLISELREDGHAVCGLPESGYYLAETVAELEQCCAFLRSRAMHSLVLEARLRKVPLPELIGQLKLPA